jgi:hypothetical protein
LGGGASSSGLRRTDDDRVHGMCITGYQRYIAVVTQPLGAL